jgi:hypothetical protein
MNHQTKTALIQEATSRRTRLSDQKGEEYTVQPGTFNDDEADVLLNFKTVGDCLDLDPVVVCGVYLQKHMDSIHTFIRKYKSADTLDKRIDVMSEGEGIESRLDDARNYLDLMECLIYEAIVEDGTYDPGNYSPDESFRNPKFTLFSVIDPKADKA